MPLYCLLPNDNTGALSLVYHQAAKQPQEEKPPGAALVYTDIC